MGVGWRVSLHLVPPPFPAWLLARHLRPSAHGVASKSLPHASNPDLALCLPPPQLGSWCGIQGPSSTAWHLSLAHPVHPIRLSSCVGFSSPSLAFPDFAHLATHDTLSPSTTQFFGMPPLCVRRSLPMDMRPQWHDMVCHHVLSSTPRQPLATRCNAILLSVRSTLRRGASPHLAH